MRLFSYLTKSILPLFYDSVVIRLFKRKIERKIGREKKKEGERKRRKEQERVRVRER